MMTDTTRKVTKKTRPPRRAGEWVKPAHGNTALKKLLASKGLPYRDAARMIGVSARHLAFVLAGQRSANRVYGLIANLPSTRKSA